MDVTKSVVPVGRGSTTTNVLSSTKIARTSITHASFLGRYASVNYGEETFFNAVLVPAVMAWTSNSCSP